MQYLPSRRVAWIVACLLALSAGLAVATPPRAAEGDTGASVAPIDLNRASAEELTALPGIGKALAERIVAFREEHGPFRRVEDLMKVKGIGEKSFDKLRPRIKVSKER